MSNEKMTQEQINALFSKESSEIEQWLMDESKEEGYQDYDFNRPDKFNLENIRSLKSIANVFSRGFSQIMSASLRTNINVRLNGKSPVEQVPYASEYIEKIGKDYFAFCIVDLGNKDLRKIIIEIDISLVLAMHRNQLGSGKNLMIQKDHRALTEIEKITLEQIVHEKIFPQLEEAFRNVAHFNLRLEKIESDPQYVKVTRNLDMIALIGFDVEYGTPEDTRVLEMGMKLCIPYLSIEPIMEKLTTENASEYKLESDELNEHEIILTHANWIEQELTVEIGKTFLKVKDLLLLEKGDVVPTNRMLQDDMVGYIAGIPKFSCVPGKSDGKMAIRVTGFAKREEDPHGGQMDG